MTLTAVSHERFIAVRLQVRYNRSFLLQSCLEVYAVHMDDKHYVGRITMG